LPNGLAGSPLSLLVPKLIAGRTVQFLPRSIGTPKPSDALLATRILSFFDGGKKFSNVWVAADVARKSRQTAPYW
jgi:hypothetical protein